MKGNIRPLHIALIIGSEIRGHVWEFFGDLQLHSSSLLYCDVSRIRFWCVFGVRVASWLDLQVVFLLDQQNPLR
jgi:hypothetical protein